MRPLTLIALLLLAATATATPPSVTFTALSETENTDPQVWRQLAIDARQAGDLDTAAAAIERAASLGLSPISAIFERARQDVVKGDADAAVEKLESLVALGFTAVGAMQGDPVVGTLAGNPGYDALVADLEEKAFPCAHDERFRAFDFWLGDWDVHVANGTFAGHNSIESAERGCVLIERWTSASGGSGHSINYLDHATGEWVQLWNGADGSQIAIRGGMTDEGMLLEGSIHYVATGLTAPFRGLWTPLDDGRVRQYFEQSNDGGETWSPWFEGFYTRRTAGD